ncbi:MAG: hypothetical protein AUH78_23070 [Gemmatimonadetes bacterium 13_1_40CM_4_69_8]|nr:MAG: hypothetical protein AUH78_23070 [Gemmatimonadetes bacterium 13_1_40CM_4_69_8]
MELLRAFRRAFRTLDLPGRIIATDIDPLAPALQEADVRYMVPRYTAPHYVPALVEICRREQASLVFPLIDPDIPLLAAARDAFRQTAARPAVVSPEAAAIAADKWQTNRFFPATSAGYPSTSRSS